MRPHLKDPFRGAKARCILEADRTILDMELMTARRALRAARCDIKDIDLILATSFLSDNPGMGHSAFLAEELGYDGAAWNIESACNSAVVCLDLLSSAVHPGR